MFAVTEKVLLIDKLTYEQESSRTLLMKHTEDLRREGRLDCSQKMNIKNIV